MPRTISAELLAALSEGVVPLSTLVLLELTNGTKLGFTSADVPIAFGGVTYEPNESVGASAVASTSGTGVDNMDVSGVLSDDRITETDLSNGLYDGARILVRIVNRADLGMGAVTILDGRIGEIQISDGAFTAECRSLAGLLKQNVGDVTSRLCRCRRVGDAQCRVAMAGSSNGGYANTVTLTVQAVGAKTLTLGPDSAPSGHYAWGVLKCTAGPNVGRSVDIKGHTLTGGAAVLTLRTAFPAPVQVGDTFQVEVGCDRLFATCRDKFGNANNYHGEWDLPGNDKILKTGRTS